MRLSYSQAGEDLVLDFIFECKKTWFYIDIGANHPARLSNTLLFYKKWWSGINIEPNVTLFKAFLQKRNRDINLNIWVGPTSNTSLDFYIIQPDTLSTFDTDSAKLYEVEWHPIIQIQKIPIISLNDIFVKYVWNREVDFISIDTEWYDMQVLESNDWSKNRPNFVILETLEYKKNGYGKKLNYIYDDYFMPKKYYKYSDSYINTIYISSEGAEKYKLSID